MVECFESRMCPSTCTVSNLGDTGHGEGLNGDLRYCLELANAQQDADRIEFLQGLAGTIVLEQGILPILAPVEIDGPGAAVLTLDAQLQSGIFVIPEIAEDISVSIRDLTLTRGIGYAQFSWRDGGALYNYEGDLNLTGVTITNNAIQDQASSAAQAWPTTTETCCCNPAWYRTTQLSTLAPGAASTMSPGPSP